MNVVAIKVYVLARNDSITPGYTDTKTYTLGSTTLGPFNYGYKRHLLTRTIRLANPSSRREASWQKKCRPSHAFTRPDGRSNQEPFSSSGLGNPGSHDGDGHLGLSPE